jgi:lycopene beta-cyclase
MKHFDYIITGAGAAGLMLAFRMANDPYFDQKSIALIDLTKKTGNDRTWCFWEKQHGHWDNLLSKTWKNIFFGGPGYEKRIDIFPYAYKMIRSVGFYKALWGKLDTKSNFTFIRGKIETIQETQEGATVKTDQDQFTASKVFNSVLLSREFEQQDKFPLLQQHFVGWFIKTKQDHFDENMATFMDFRVPQHDNTRFMYLLPMTSNSALVEYTLFSENLLKPEEYEQELKAYLDKHGIRDYTIEETEKGSIPMTSFDFGKNNTRNILNIGTAGGWTKASTGYTFMNTTKKTADLIIFLKKQDDLSTFNRKTKFWLYDLVLLDVLSQYNHLGAALFTRLFKKVKTQNILKFLDEETTILEDFQVILSMPTGLFTRVLLRRIFRF